MSDDLLERATRALRETSAEPQPRSGLTRARILDGAQKRHAPRGVLVRWLIGISAALAASTALARVAEHWPEIKEIFAPAAATPAKSGARRAPLSAAGSAAPSRPVLPPVQDAAAQAQASEPQGAALAPGPELRASGSGVGSDTSPRVERAARPRRARAPQPVASGPDRDRPKSSTATADAAPPTAAGEIAPPAQPAELALFRRAERLHLAQDPGAVAAWDAYLRVAGQGLLAPEARYNRALALVRQGRIAEARHALGMFARGELGGYRRVEAQRLLEVLAHRPDRR